MCVHIIYINISHFNQDTKQSITTCQKAKKTKYLVIHQQP